MDKLYLFLNWRVRMIGEGVTLAIFLLGLAWYDAPGWAYVLLVYTGTRTARIDSAADFGALQSTIKAQADDQDEDPDSPRWRAR